MTIQIFSCGDLGVQGTTNIHVRKMEDYYEARMGIAMMGATNMTDEERALIKDDPYHPDFYDNYVHGVGKTAEEAVEAMKADLRQASNILFM